MTFENAGKTLLVVHDLYPSNEALDAAVASGSTGGMPDARPTRRASSSLGSQRQNDAVNQSTNEACGQPRGQEDRPRQDHHEAAGRHDGQGKRREGRGRRRARVRLHRQPAAAAARIAERIDALAAKTLPDLQRAVKWGMAYYGVDGGWCFSSGAFVGHVKLMFIRGTEIKPEPPVTPIGMGKSTRGVEPASVDDLDERQAASWMKQAAAMPFVGGKKR